MTSTPLIENSFNPREHPERCEAYFSQYLEARIDFIRAEPLVKSTRLAPWRLDVEVDGEARSFVLRLDARGMEHEYKTLRIMQQIPIPTPRAYGWDTQGEYLGVPCFFCDFIEGESLLNAVLTGEAWAEALFIETVCELQAISREQLESAEYRFDGGESAVDILDDAHEYLKSQSHPLAEVSYTQLTKTMPPLPAVRFSNGDLWLDNLIVRDQQLAGVIDFEHAGFSDPIFEFMLSSFIKPELRARGIEERYCEQMGFDPQLLPWYHALECFDTLRWVLLSGEPFEGHTRESLSASLTRWLAEM